MRCFPQKGRILPWETAWIEVSARSRPEPHALLYATKNETFYQCSLRIRYLSTLRVPSPFARRAAVITLAPSLSDMRYGLCVYAPSRTYAPAPVPSTRPALNPRPTAA